MSAAKIVSAQDLEKTRDRFAAAGKKLVFTNGCFDILHVGHVRCLQMARALGDGLAVAINSDDAVKILKGPTRPVNSETDRAEVLAALACVDYVVICDTVRFGEFFKVVRPQIYAKGGDYAPGSLEASEKAALDAAGAEIRFIPFVPGKSTSNIIAACQN